jgi:hypothetical protein
MMGAAMSDKRKPTFGAVPVDNNPVGKNGWRDFHSGRWSAAKIHGAGYGQFDPYIGGYIMPSELRDPGHRVDQTLPTPLPPKDAS